MDLVKCLRLALRDQKVGDSYVVDIFCLMLHMSQLRDVIMSIVT